MNSYGISAIQFADGTAWDYTFIASNAWIRGTAGIDSIGLPANAATVDAGAGDDTLSVSGTGPTASCSPPAPVTMCLITPATAISAATFLI